MENKTLVEETNKNIKLFVYSDSLVVSLLPSVALRPPLASLSIQESTFFGTYDNLFCLSLLVFQNNNQQAQVSSFETFIVILRA